MAQNRFLTAAENLWNAVEAAKGAATTLIVKRIFHQCLNQPHQMPLSNTSHPMYMYSRGSMDTIRERIRNAFRTSTEDDDALTIIDELTQTAESPLYVLLTTAMTRYRQWRIVLENGSDSDSDSD